MQKTAPTRPQQPHLPLVCPVWHSPLLHVTASGIEIRCKSCKEKHALSRAMIEQIWQALAEENPCLRSESGAEDA